MTSDQRDNEDREPSASSRAAEEDMPQSANTQLRGKSEGETPADVQGSITDENSSKNPASSENEAADSEDEDIEDGEYNDATSSDREITDSAPPLPSKSIPPLPSETPPATAEEDDGWAPVWEESAQAFYFYNRFTGATQWTNPRVPEATPSIPALPSEETPAPAARPAGGYDPAIHGDYDPEAWYAQTSGPAQPTSLTPADPTEAYAATGAFNRFTGRWQASDLNPENFNDENKSKRQMNAFFDVDAAANSHDGRSLKAERSGKKLSKSELKQFKEKRKAKKEEKRRAWLRD